MSFVCCISLHYDVGVYFYSSLFFDYRIFFFFLMIRRPPRSTLDRSSAASDVYKRQMLDYAYQAEMGLDSNEQSALNFVDYLPRESKIDAVSYTHLRAHETVLDLVCRLLLEKKKTQLQNTHSHLLHTT